MYNLLEYSKNYRKTVGSLHNYYRDELDDDADLNKHANNNVVSSNGFKYKSKLLGNTPNVNSTNDPAVNRGARPANPNYNANESGRKLLTPAVPLKYLGNFWRALDIPLINCEVSLELKWDKNCVITSKQINRNLDGGNTVAPTGARFTISSCKLCVPVVTLSKDDEIKLLTNLKSGFKREIIWNKYMSQMSTQPANNNLNILIDPTFTNVNRLFVLAYPLDENNDDNRKLFFQFYLRSVMIKDYNVIIDNLSFFELPIKNEEEAYEKIIDNSGNNEYTTDNLSDYAYFKKYYKLIAIDLSKQEVLQENRDLIQQINFIGQLPQQQKKMLKKENAILEFSQNFANVLYKTKVYFVELIKMENQKIINLLNKSDTNSRHFATKKWYVINDLNNAAYGVDEYGRNEPANIKYETKVLKPNLCDYSDEYILVTGIIRTNGGNNTTKVSLENCAPFRKCILHINDEYV